MNTKPAEEIESVARSLGLEPPPFVTEGSSEQKKKKLKKKFQAATTSSSPPRDKTPSPPRDPSIVEIPSSIEKDTVTSKVISEVEAGDSSEMDYLAEDEEEQDEESKGKSSSDIFVGLGDIFPLPFFSSKGDYASELTSSKLQISSHPSHS